MCHIFKFRSAFGNEKCALKNIKSDLFLFSALCPFLSPKERLVIVSLQQPIPDRAL